MIKRFRIRFKELNIIVKLLLIVACVAVFFGAGYWCVISFCTGSTSSDIKAGKTIAQNKRVFTVEKSGFSRLNYKIEGSGPLLPPSENFKNSFINIFISHFCSKDSCDGVLLEYAILLKLKEHPNNMLYFLTSRKNSFNLYQYTNSDNNKPCLNFNNYEIIDITKQQQGRIRLSLPEIMPIACCIPDDSNQPFECLKAPPYVEIITKDKRIPWFLKGSVFFKKDQPHSKNKNKPYLYNWKNVKVMLKKIMENNLEGLELYIIGHTDKFIDSETFNKEVSTNRASIIENAIKKDSELKKLYTSIGKKRIHCYSCDYNFPIKNEEDDDYVENYNRRCDVIVTSNPSYISSYYCIDGDTNCSIEKCTPVENGKEIK